MSEADVLDTVRANRGRRAILSPSGPFDLTPRALAVLATVPEWWRRRVISAGLGVEFAHRVDLAIETEPPIDLASLNEIECEADLLDASPESLANAYVVALDDNVRSAEGRHYTPPVLAEALYGQATRVLGRSPRGLVWDPACGSGALLLPALRTLLRERAGAEPELLLAAVRTSIGGRDLDIAAVWLGNVLLAAELLPVWASVPTHRRRPLPAVLEVGDGLTRPRAQPEMVLMNPPYGRVRLRQEDRTRWAHVVYGHANKYGLFLANAAEMVTTGGVVSALVPAGWLGGSYFRRLRDHVATTAPLRHLTYVAGRSGVFSTGVLQETVLATFLRSGDPASVVCERMYVNGEARRDSVGSAALPDVPEKPWLLPRSLEDLPLVAAATAMGHRLADYGWTVSTGPLVWNRHKPRLSAVPRPGSAKVVWAADLEGGRLHRDPARDRLRYVQFDDEREREVLVLDRPAVLVQRTTASEQQRRLLAAAFDSATLAEWNDEVVVENHVNVLTLEEPNSPLTATLLAALLDSEALDRLYRCLSGSVAVSAYELAALPLPPPEVLDRLAGVPTEDLSGTINALYRLPR